MPIQIGAKTRMYKQHISVDDELVFPLAERLLSGNEKEAIAKEMANRRLEVLRPKSQDS